MELTAAERILVHLHSFWNESEPSRDATQAGIAEGAKILRSHVPRSLRALEAEGLIEPREARLRGRTRKVRVYALTEAGVRRARALVDEIDRTRVDADGRTTSLGEARRSLGLPPLVALGAVDARGRWQPQVPELERPALLQREADLAFLRRWLVGGVPIAVVYGSRGMGKTSLGWTFARTVPRSIWISVEPTEGLEAFARATASASGVRADDPSNPDSLAKALADIFRTGTKLVVLDGYGEVPEGVVDAMASFVLRAKGSPGKLLVLAQEGTPAYCRFYGRQEIEDGVVVDRHLRGLDMEGCRAMLGNASIDDESLRRIYLLTKGSPLLLRAIREGDEATLRAHSRFTRAEIRLLLYSGRAAG